MILRVGSQARFSVLNLKYISILSHGGVKLNDIELIFPQKFDLNTNFILDRDIDVLSFLELVLSENLTDNCLRLGK